MRHGGGVWKVVAALALALSAVLLWRAPKVVATQSGQLCEPADDREVSDEPTERASVNRSGSVHGRRFGAALEAARTWRARCTALGRLARGGQVDEQAVDRVIGLTQPTSELELRLCATSALGALPSEAALARLLVLLDEGNERIAEEAARALAQRDEQEARDALVSLAKLGSPSQRMTAALALAEAGAPEAAPLIAELLTGVGRRDQDRLLMALGATGDPAALPVLLQAATSGSRSAQYSAISALGELGGDGATRTLVGLLQTRPALASVIAGALARSADPSAEKALLSVATSSRNGNVANAARQALQAYDTPDVRALMMRSLESGNPVEMSAAMDYFGVHTAGAAAPQLMKLAQEGSPRAYGAIHALASNVTAEGRALIESVARGSGPLHDAALVELANMPGGAERAKAIALAQVQRGGAQQGQAIELLANDESPEARAALIALARRADPGVSSQALMGLSQRSDPESRAVLVEVAERGASPEQRTAALWTLAQTGDPAVSKTLRAAMSSDNAQVRSQAISAYAQLGESDAEPALVAASKDKESEVAMAAASALGQLGTPGALTRLEELARARDPSTSQFAIRVLASTSPERATPLAEAMIGSSDVESRQLAIGLSGSLSGAAGARIVLAGVRDTDPGVVRDALGNIAFADLSRGETQQALRDLLVRESLPAELREQAKQLLANQALVRADSDEE
ncbi:MAG: hypothetical protein RLZZ450_768 [Pseudomonadota bacterium]